MPPHRAPVRRSSGQAATASGTASATAAASNSCTRAPRQRHQRRIAFGTASSPQPSPHSVSSTGRPQRLCRRSASSSINSSGIRPTNHSSTCLASPKRDRRSSAQPSAVRGHPAGKGIARTHDPSLPEPAIGADRRDTDAVVEAVAALAALHRLGHRAVHLAAQLASSAAMRAVWFVISWTEAPVPRRGRIRKAAA